MGQIMTRLLSFQLEVQEKRILDVISDIIGENIGVLRGEVAQERKERTADVERIEARIAALETRPPPRAQPSESEMLCAVGGYGRFVNVCGY